ncbi:MAG: trigger factor [Candidatus Harrisonbacteria bacterium]|nr:trigger factor [Candidatus Harrisonbacteria bacterium]
MKTQIKEEKNSQLLIEVELSKEDFEPHWEGAYAAAAAKIELKGFRKGTAPQELVDGAIDKDKVFQEALNDGVRESLSEISKEKNWTIIDQPKIEVKETKPDGGLLYSAQITIFPQIKLADYKKIGAKIFSQKIQVKVDDEEVKKTIDYVRKSRAKETLVKRPAKEGDLLELNIETFSEGKEVPNSKFEKERFVLGESRFVDGFDKELEGKKEGEKLEFSLTAPKEYWNKDYQGKKLDFNVEVLGVYDRELPELSNEFARSLGPNFKTLEDITKNIREGIQAEKEAKEKEKQRLAVLETIIKESKMDVPDVMVERTLDHMVSDMRRMLPKEEQEKEGFDQELRKQFKDRAQQNVKGHLVIHEIAHQEKLTPSTEEIEAHAGQRGVDAQTHYDQLHGELQNQKVFTFLENSAKK